MRDDLNAKIRELCESRRLLGQETPEARRILGDHHLEVAAAGGA
ncbi:MAG TPA: hypothetical protein VMM36_16440 [Opitutaceae bacterium]|nr:hypothetical protein [Opitutaceae bacterium]